MSPLVKLLMIVLIIIAFSSGIANFAVLFFPGYSSTHLVVSMISFVLSYALNEEIIILEEEKNSSNEYF